jgi:hypothetical protein
MFLAQTRVQYLQMASDQIGILAREDNWQFNTRCEERKDVAGERMAGRDCLGVFAT